jgi:hypothetical protein
MSQRQLFLCATAVSQKFFAITLILALVCRPSLAQTSKSDWGNVQNLDVGTAISVKDKAGAKYHGELVRVSADSLVIDSDERRLPGRIIRLRKLEKDDVREVRLVKPIVSMVAGTAIGGGIGAGLGVAADSTAKSHEYRGLIAFLLGSLGAGIGLAVASHHPFIKGKVVYVAP